MFIYFDSKFICVIVILMCALEFSEQALLFYTYQATVNYWLFPDFTYFIVWIKLSFKENDAWINYLNKFLLRPHQDKVIFLKIIVQKNDYGFNRKGPWFYN